MPVKFMLANEATRWFFTWLTECGPDPEALIAKAFNEAIEGGPLVAADYFPPLHKLIDLLDQYLDAAQQDAITEIRPKFADPSKLPGRKDEFVLRLLSIAVERIEVETVARALLIQYGKWNPNQDFPGDSSPAT